jgi:hypothetical protein
MHQIIHEFQKNAAEIVRFSLTEFKGHRLIDIRVFFEVDDEEWKPTKKGVSLAVDLVDDLFDGVSKLKETIHR